MSGRADRYAADWPKLLIGLQKDRGGVPGTPELDALAKLDLFPNFRALFLKHQGLSS